MTLSGQVYAMVPDAKMEFDGNRQASAIALLGQGIYDLGGEGGIYDGQLNFTIGRPLQAPTLWGITTLFEGFDDIYRDFTIYPDNARAAALLGLTTVGEGFSGWLERINLEKDENTSTLDEVNFIYVDRDVTITARGMTQVFEYEYTVWRIMTVNLNINLESGWNVLHTSHTTTITEIDDLVIGSETVSLSATDPDWVKWTLQEIEDDTDELHSSLSRRLCLPVWKRHR
ncbi:MAG: hypothetical protein FWB78_08605 [Treponema sp.]|nr:hypothetical protein [Treponema sp.]